MRRTPLAAALVAVLAAPAAAPAAPVHVLQADGDVVVRDDRFTPALVEPGPRTVVPRAPLAGARAAAARKTVPGELRRMLLAGAIDQATHDRWRDVFDDSRRTWKRLSGRRRAELGAVIRTVQDLAASGRLTVTRSPSAFLTLARNRAWWAAGPLLAYGRRVGFAGSRLVWQSYPGQGLQIQWLGTFGKANAFFSTGEHDAELRELLAEAERLAVQRAGGHAWEYLFRFDGGRPPWVSALAQGTALQAYSRGAIRLSEPRLFEVARGGLGIFRAAPPEGVRAPGDHYLIYSSLPRLRVLNGFVQALNGLLDFARLANDEEGRALFAAGEARLRAEIGRYDTGAWSMYSTRRESDLGYHKLVRDFLRGLCTRLVDARDRASAVQLDPSGGAAPAPPPPAFPDPAPYCDTAERFTGYLRTPPELEVQRATLRQGRRGAVRFTLSKISTVTLEVRRRGALVHRAVVRLGAGRRSLPLKPDKAGPLRVRLRAVDLAGNVGHAAGVVRVRPKR